MGFEPLFYAYLVLCVAVFLDVLITFRKNSLLKLYFLLIIASLFVMNYFSYVSVANRFQFVFVKATRVVYVCTTMLAIIHLVSPKTPRWIILLVSISSLYLVGLRIFYFNEIDVQSQVLSNPVFSVGAEFHSPHPVAKYLVFTLAMTAVAITFYYYRLFLMKMDREAVYYKHLSRWVICMVVPFFLLIIFGVLCNLNIFQKAESSYLFSFFSYTIIFSLLLRPKFLNTTSYAEVCRPQTAMNPS
jgi:hypothetical protein